MRFLWRFNWMAMLGAVAASSSVLAADPEGTARMVFRDSGQATYVVEKPSGPASTTAKSDLPNTGWVRAWPDGKGEGDYIKFGPRIVLELKKVAEVEEVLRGRPLRISRRLSAELFILEGTETWTALREAEALAEDARVLNCHPVAIRPKQLFNNYAPPPNDPYFSRPDLGRTDWQPYLENRSETGQSAGVDLNVRSAWPISTGRDVMMAIADDGVELTHPDLSPQIAGAPHRNFVTGTANGMPAGPLASHGTAVAGLAVAKGNNKIGISGVAPDARLASWVLFSSRDRLEISDEALMDMFQYQSNRVSIQNHSWGKDGRQQLRVSTLENHGISNALALGRSGLGVIMVRAAGNGRGQSHNANDDGYLADHRVIPVAAVRLDGRVAQYSNPGACVLVAAPSGDKEEEDTPCASDSPLLLTTDRQGSLGYNTILSVDDRSNYTFGAAGFSGTSAATPQISGIAALILGANPGLGYRDVQQILIHSSRHYDFEDPDLKLNAAGFLVSHNLGFGIPDAGVAVRLAQRWPNRPALTNVTYSSKTVTLIPDLGLRLLLEGENIPEGLSSFPALPGLGPFPDERMAPVRLQDVGLATQPVLPDLNGKAALIQRGENFFCEKLSAAAAAGASFAVIFNNRDQDVRIMMGATDFSPIPSLFLSQRDGLAVRDIIRSNPSARARIALQKAKYTFDVKESLLCEHVAVRVDTDHTTRGDLRITLISPKGTRSVLQSWNNDTSFGPVNWTYYSVHHYYEPSQGEWTVEVTDLDNRGSGRVRSVQLTVFGTAIVDADADGLDDAWELSHLKTLASGPQDDPDEDGQSNAREQILNTNPLLADLTFEMKISLWNQQLARLSWPGTTNVLYEISSGNNPAGPLHLVTNVPGRFPETEFFIPYTNLLHQFFRVQANPLKIPAR